MSTRTDILEEPVAPIFRDNPAERGSRCFHYVGTSLPDDGISHTRRQLSSRSVLWESQMSLMYIPVLIGLWLFYSGFVMTHMKDCLSLLFLVSID